MLEHLSNEEIEGYRKRAIPLTRLLDVDKHLSACETCRRRVKETSVAPSAVNNLKTSLHAAAQSAPDHLAYETMQAYVKNQADPLDREIVESHVELCALCAKELNDLQEFAAMMNEPQVVGKSETQEASFWKNFF